MEPVRLRTRRLVLDLPVPGDAERVERYCHDPLFERYLTTPWPYRRSDAESFLETHVPDSWRTGAEATWALRLADDDGLLGVVSVRAEQYELGYWIGREHRGHGYMSEAANAVVEWAFDAYVPDGEHLLWRAVAGNRASAHVARSAGFRRFEPEDATLERRGGGADPAWFARRGRRVADDAAASWNGVLDAPRSTLP